jgi:Ca2+-transporting ATPase
MPVHILFLQLIIDPACSVVFEAEPVEGSMLRARPRDPKSRLFDNEVLGRGLGQGIALFAMLVLVYAHVRNQSGSDDLARAMTFTVLVLSNLALIAANRSWNRSSLFSHGERNPSFAWAIGATLAALAAVLGIPVIRQLFGFALPSPLMLLAAVALSAMSLIWFGRVNHIVSRRWPSVA